MSANQNSRHRNKSGRNNKQNNRNRNQHGRGRKGGGKKQVQQPLTTSRQVDSNGPSGKIRGNVKQLYDKYKALAHENRTKDRITSEAHNQFAHHYYVLYSEISAAEAAQEVEREKEKERLKAEAAENQSNVVSINGENATDVDAEVTSAEPQAEEANETEAPKRKPRTRKKAPKEKDNMPELPLEEAEEKVKVERPKKRARSVKKEVAE